MKPTKNCYICHRQRWSRHVVSLVLLLTLSVFAGCDQPIYNALNQPLPNAEIEMASANEQRHNWPVRDNFFTVAKPPPLAYLTSYGEPITTPPLELPDDSFWNSVQMSDEVRPYIEDLFLPLPTEPHWVGTISKAEFAGPQAFDMSIDGKRLVTVNDGQFALFQTSNGKRIGRRDLPGDWKSGPPNAVRFAPKTNDFLVASSKKVCRISSKDGSLIGEIEGPGEPIKKWLVADDESYMVMLTESGRLFAGDGALQSLGPLKLIATDDDATFDDFGMSLDGVRLLVTVGKQPRTYLQEGGKIVDFIEHSHIALSESPVISSGLRDDFWATTATVFFTHAEKGPNSNAEFDPNSLVTQKIAMAPQRESGTVEMFWRIAHLRPIRNRPGEGGEWAMAISQRPVDGKLQWVVHDINLTNRRNSVALPIGGPATRFITGRWGTNLAIANDDNIRLVDWKFWRTRFCNAGRYTSSNLFNTGDLKNYEQLCSILHEKEWWTLIGSSEDVLAEIVDHAAERWRWLVMRRDVDGGAMDAELNASLDRYEAWFQKGSFWARTTHAHRLHLQAWAAREGNDEQGGDSWSRYADLRRQAASEFEALMQQDRPAAVTIARHLGCFLESSDDMDVADKICRRSVELYPRTLLVASGMAFKMLPRWHGEAGDCLSFAKSHAQLFAPPLAGLLYANLIGNFTYYLGNSAYHFSAIDTQLLNQGLDHYMQSGAYPERWFLRNQMLYQILGTEDERAEKMNRYLLQTRATMPPDVTLFANRNLYNNQTEWRRLRDEAGQ
ncbi:MAG: hypothetical protein KDB00_01150 [Planctomycetales bacterium]|nr:hypothetical protein [Planctomycetales bacterium]